MQLSGKADNPKLAGILIPMPNDSYCLRLYNSGPMVRHYALMYGFHMLSDLLKSSLRATKAMWLSKRADRVNNFFRVTSSSGGITNFNSTKHNFGSPFFLL